MKFSSTLLSAVLVIVSLQYPFANAKRNSVNNQRNRGSTQGINEGEESTGPSNANRSKFARIRPTAQAASTPPSTVNGNSNSGNSISTNDTSASGNATVANGTSTNSTAAPNNATNSTAAPNNATNS